MNSLFKRILIELVNLVFAAIMAIVVFVLIRHYWLQPFQVDGYSMNSTFNNGDQVFMIKHQALERFDVVVFPDPMGSGESYVKRIIALPGDRLYAKDGKVYLNDHLLNEPYLDFSLGDEGENFTSDFSLWDVTGKTEVPPGYVFVLGDNRPHSGDSRQFGFVDQDSIMGHAQYIYYPFDRMRKIEEYQIDLQSLRVKTL